MFTQVLQNMTYVKISSKIQVYCMECHMIQLGTGWVKNAKQQEGRPNSGQSRLANDRSILEVYWCT